MKSRLSSLAVSLRVTVLALSIASIPAATLDRFEFERPQMGVPFRIVLYAPNRAAAERAATAAFDRVHELNAILSDYESDSELSKLSRSAGQGKVVPVSSDLWTVLESAQSLAAKSQGAFDITIGPAVTVWRRARRTRSMPPQNELDEILRRIGFQYLKLDRKDHTAELAVAGMRLDLGGIAKGFAVDEAMKELSKRGITNALVAAAGDILVSEPPPTQSGWRIAVSGLDVTGDGTSRNVLLKNAAISTSGDLAQHVELGGKRYSHIVDPHTGIGLTDHSVVTVIAANSMLADSLATAVSVLGPAQGMELIKSIGNAAARIVRMPDQKIEVNESDGFSKHTIAE
jgi:FAD:protein FMN transferase